MEETKNLWNKRMDELTMKDVVVINLVAPVIAVGSVVAIGFAFKGYESAAAKVQSIRTNRRFKKLTKV